MSMVESGLGISILPELILRRIPYRIISKELNVPAYRTIGIAYRDKKNLSLATKKFIDYLQYRL
jgi:DNA-binding transcriptional LysR family regulator